MSGQGFQFTPFGVLPIGAAVPAVGDAVSGGVVVEAPREQEPKPAHVLDAETFDRVQERVLAIGKKAGGPLTGKQIAKMARERAREIKCILANVPALEKELAMLRSLLAVATPQRRKKALQ